MINKINEMIEESIENNRVDSFLEALDKVRIKLHSGRSMQYSEELMKLTHSNDLQGGTK